MLRVMDQHLGINSIHFHCGSVGPARPQAHIIFASQASDSSVDESKRIGPVASEDAPVINISSADPLISFRAYVRIIRDSLHL